MKNELFQNINLHSDGIWGEVNNYGDQKDEKLLRQSVANKKYNNYLLEISKHHSISVMDKEVNEFISKIDKNGIILDLGGCWGWHWRNITNVRPDLTIVIVDLIRDNLIHAKTILKNKISNGNIFLVHGNACSLKFKANCFDGVWSVQTTQHIPNYDKVCSEVYRVLKDKGIFSDYGLNNALIVRIIYNLFGKKYHLDGKILDKFYLRRVNNDVFNILKKVFKNNISIRYTELLFTPDIGLSLGGKEKSFIGKIDSYISGKGWIRKLIARQCSTHATKND